MAELHVAGSDLNAAIENLEKALSLQPQFLEAQRRLVMVYTTAGKPEQALAVAQQVQKQRPKESVGYLFEGDVYATGKRWDEALAAYRRGMKQTRSPDLAMRLHEVLLHSGDEAGAKQFVATWLKDNPKDEIFRLHLAQTAMVRQDFAAAAEQYRKILENHPDNPILLNNLAWALVQLKDPKAVEYAEQANKLVPNQPALMDTLGVLLVAKGETARGLELLRQAAALSPKSSHIRFNLAKALLQAGNKEEAKKELDELAKLGRKFPRHAEVTQLRQGL
jgi:putative PEP-CTERM system TPR-repeat lipoprotein